MLLAQLMTLWFNMQTSAPLATVSLIEDTLITKSQTTCGSNIPTGEGQKYGLPHNVIVYLNGGNGYSADINGLYILANDLLGGLNISLSASDVQNAISSVNNAFEGCKVLTGTLPYAPFVPTLVKRSSNTEVFALDFSVSVFPNPASSMFNIKVNSAYQDKLIAVNVSDALGRKIETKTIRANETVQIGKTYKTGLYFVTIIQGKEQKQLKLIKLTD